MKTDIEIILESFKEGMKESRRKHSELKKLMEEYQNIDKKFKDYRHQILKEES